MIIYFCFRELLNLYEECETEKEVREVEKNWLEKCEQEYQAVKSIGKPYWFLLISYYP